MKSILSFVAVCALATVVGCSSTKSNSVSPGAVGDKNGCCSSKAAGCCTDKNTDKNKSTSMGAMGDKATCTKTCPMTGKTETVSPGAMGEKKGCCASKSACTGKKIDG